MNCPVCQTVNPAQARFCMGCGYAFVQGVTCRSCLTLLPTNARFCFNCGTMTIVTSSHHNQQTSAIAPLPQQPTQPPPSVATPAVATPVVVTQATAVTPPSSSPAQPTAVAPTEAPPTATTSDLLTLPPARPIRDLLPLLKKYLPKSLHRKLDLYPDNPELVKKRDTRNLEAARDHIAAVLATAKTYLPHPVIETPQPAGVPTGGMFDGTFLFVDVSGFTPLNEKLSRYPDGAERVTSIINDLFLQLVQTLFDHGGTLLKFGGDALLGLFISNTKEEHITGALHASQAALKMQEIILQFTNIDVGEGQTHALRIKCGISSGSFFAAHIGTKDNMGFVTTGHTVNEAELAEGNAEPGEVVMTQNAYELLQETVSTEPRNEGYYLLLEAPLSSETLKYTPLQEPPPGELDAQITYLVDRMERLAPYLANELLPRLVDAQDPTNVVIQPERRPVTVMFANYVGIGDLIRDLGDTHPEIITQQLNSYFVHMAQVVEKYEGTLARMDQYSKGDRLVIFFGAPRAHEDDPLRAVYTALDMQKAVHEHFAALQTPEGIYRFRQRIGINTGYLFAGNAGAPELRQEYTLMGDDINTAARMMSIADLKKQEIYITNKTQGLVYPFIELEDLGNKQVKGKAITIHTYRVLRIIDKMNSARGLGKETPYTGRTKEFRLIQRSGQKILNGRSQIVSVIGDSGRGKSRLTREFRAWLTEQDTTGEIKWLEARALSFTENISNWLLTQVIQSALDLEEGVRDEDILFALWEKGEELLGKENARDAIPFLAALFGLQLEGDWAKWVQDLSPDVRRKQTAWALREFFKAYASKQPTVIILDDLHWADEASIALFSELLPITDSAPLMLLLIFREQRTKGCWQLRDKVSSNYNHRYEEIMLAPLSRANSRRLLGVLLPGAKFSNDISNQILEKSTGNPFYLEEVVRSLIDSEAVVPDPENEGHWLVTDKIEDITVPDTLQGAIVARLDNLTEGVRQGLRMAAVIGRQFELKLLRGLAKSESEMEGWLSELQKEGLIQLTGSQRSSSSNGGSQRKKAKSQRVMNLLDNLMDEPTEDEADAQDATYTFPDALVQEVAYDSLLVRRRQTFHGQVGLLLEKVFKDDLEQKCELLAYHFWHSDDIEKAIYYVEMAGQRAEAAFANETAVTYYNQLLELLAKQDRDNWEKQFNTLLRRQKIYRIQSNYDARQADLDQMATILEAHDAPSYLGDLYVNKANLYQAINQYDQAFELAEKALALKTQVADKKGIAQANAQLGALHYIRGNYDKAESTLQQARLDQQEVADRDGEGWSTMYLGMIQLMQGNYDGALKYHTQAMDIAKARNDWFQRGIHLTNAARVDVRLGLYQAALLKFEESQEMRNRVGDLEGQGFTMHGMGTAHYYLQNYAQAQTNFNDSLELRQKLNDERGVGFSYNGLGLVALAQGEYEQAETHFQKAYEAHHNLGLQGDVLTHLSYLSQARLGMGDNPGALEASNQAMALLEEQKSVEEVQQIYLNHFRVLRAQGDATAVAWLQKAHEAMQEQAAAIADETSRQAFLDQVSVNKEILAEME